MKAALAAEDLSFSYDEGAPLLESWSAAFDNGEMVAITGPSGRGKSTLLYLLGLMLAPQAGVVRLGGQDVTGLSDRHRAALRAHRFGFVFQDAALDPSRTVLDNVLETVLYRGGDRRAEEARARSLLADLGVAVRAEARPGQVSGGQAQRIALCRALLGRPSVVLADEPTGNLDPATSEVVLDALRRHAHDGAVVVVVTHEPAVVLACDREIPL